MSLFLLTNTLNFPYLFFSKRYVETLFLIYKGWCTFISGYPSKPPLYLSMAPTRGSYTRGCSSLKPIQYSEFVLGLSI